VSRCRLVIVMYFIVLVVQFVIIIQGDTQASHTFLNFWWVE